MLNGNSEFYLEPQVVKTKPKLKCIFNKQPE